MGIFELLRFYALKDIIASYLIDGGVIMEFTVAEQLLVVIIRVRMEKEKISFMSAFYKYLDELIHDLAREYQFSCCAGCSFCCYQPVLASPMELGEIRKYLEGLDAERQQLIQSRFQLLKSDWLKWIGRFDKSDPPDEEEILRQWKGIPCIFLDVQSGQCDIYPVRPIICRTTVNDQECTGFPTERLEHPLLELLKEFLTKVQAQNGVEFLLFNVFEGQ